MNMKMKLKYKLTSKIAAFLMTILMFSFMLGCIFSGFLMADDGIYSLTKEEFLERRYETYFSRDFSKITGTIIADQQFTDKRIDKVELLCANRNFASVKIWETDPSNIKWNWSNEKAKPGYTYERSIYIRSESSDAPAWLTIQITIAQEPLLVQDDYQEVYRLTSFIYTMRFWIYPIAIVALLISILCFIYLMRASGRHNNEDGIRAGWGTSIPIDLLTGGAVFAFSKLLYCMENFLNDWNNPEIFILGILALIASQIILIGWSMSFALRMKMVKWSKWWEDTLIFHLCILLWKLVKRIAKGIVNIVGYIPFIPKIIIAIVTITSLELLFIIITLGVYYNPDILLIYWVIEKFILVPIILYIAIVLYKLKKGGMALASGDLNYQTDTKYMLWDLKQHGENLNSIAKGMSLALEERIKSERMKTELITNVSHDIKTPLTSIINYADLLNKEISAGSYEIISGKTDSGKTLSDKTDSHETLSGKTDLDETLLGKTGSYETISGKVNSCETTSIQMDAGKFADIQEYTSVLLRHSKRLKRLIDDLMEASKAATGNMEVNLEPCDAAIMLTQAAGEYEQKLESAGLTIVTKQPEQPIHIMADGRRLWRIFDNLLNNICKYAQAGTRVYLTLEEQEKFAVITFKNISRDALDVSADELMERFVRGDASRHTEGNGLGLSIAKSLTELQNGTMNLDIDGDLFKVTLRFPVLHETNI